jgi:hypothetical protein
VVLHAACLQSAARRDSSCRDTVATPAPIDDLGFIDLVAGGIGGRQTRRVTDRTVDIDHPAACSTDEVVVVVADAVLEAGRRSGRLNAPEETFVSEGPEGVVHRLTRDGAQFGPDDSVDVVRGAMRSIRHGLQDSETLGSDLHTVVTKQCGVL